MANWGLVSKGVFYAMQGDRYESKLTLKANNDGDLTLPPQKFNVILDLNGTAPEPKPIEKSKEILLKVRFNPQTNNVWRSERLRPDNTCSCSSTDAFGNFFIPGMTATDDDYIDRFFDGKYGDTTDHTAHVRCCEEEFGLLTEYREDFTFDLLDKELEAGRPVIMGILHRGPTHAPSGGHVVVCRGRTADGSKYWFMDPYGSMNDGYMGSVENGECVGYPRVELETRWANCPGYKPGGLVRIFKGLSAKK
jgi:Peptidase_C39 like family